MLYDFHAHTFHSDGVLSPIELIRRASVKGYTAIALTDHVGIGSLARVIKETAADCALAQAHWNILAIVGVELTHLPPAAIAETALEAKELGAKLVIIHGESPVEPVAPGTNLAALKSAHVDILAHPGLITPQEASLAAENGIFLEITSRRGHSKTNRHVASVAITAGALLLVNSDAHDEDDLLSVSVADSIVSAAGLSEKQRSQILEQNPLLLLQRVNKTSSY